MKKTTITEISWQDMIQNQQMLCQFSRSMLLHQQKQYLTGSERELLACVYLHPDGCTPLFLSKITGMKKEAVSRCLKQLLQKECITKNKKSADERSYEISLTEKGEKALGNDYEIQLQPFYDLYRAMGEEFSELFHLIAKANKSLSDREEIKTDGVL